jgi:hypothetical protein
MSKKLKIAAFSLLGVLICFASVKAATVIGNNITTMGSIGIGTTSPANFFSIASSTSNLFDVTSSGKIGVGTSDPISFAKMQINYDSLIDGGAGLVVSDGFSHVVVGGTSTNAYIGTYNNNSFAIRTNNEDRIFVYDKNAGADVRVGIGTTTPEVKLHVSGDSSVFGNILSESQNPGLIFSSTNADPENKKWAISSGRLGNGGFLSFSALSDDLNTGYSWLQVIASSSLIGSQMNPFKRVEIYPKTYFGSNVGVGTTTPVRKLHIYNDMATTSMFDLVDEGHHPGLALKNIDGQGNWGFYNSFGDLMIGKVTDGLDSLDTKLFIDGNSGNVSIGISTTTPSSKLSIIGNSSDNSGYSLDVINSNNDNLFNIRNDGNVFIGTTTSSVANKLTISDPSNAHLQLEAPLAGVNIISDTVGDLFIQGAQSAFTSYYRNTDYAWATGMTDDSNNNFSIWFNGTTNPGAKLSITADGNVGIGTTTPDSILQVYKNNATTTVTVGGVDSATKGSCLKLRDSDGQGWTYCTTLVGTLSCSTTSCE